MIIALLLATLPLVTGIPASRPIDALVTDALGVALDVGVFWVLLRRWRVDPRSS